MKNLSNVVIVIIGIVLIIGAIWFFREDNNEIINISVNSSINNINAQLNTNSLITNINSNDEENSLIDTTEIEIIDIETDISNLSTIESDLEIPELDFDVAF